MGACFLFITHINIAVLLGKPNLKLMPYVKVWLVQQWSSSAAACCTSDVCFAKKPGHLLLMGLTSGAPVQHLIWSTDLPPPTPCCASTCGWLWCGFGQRARMAKTLRR